MEGDCGETGLPKGYATELAKSLKDKGPDYYYEAYNI